MVKKIVEFARDMRKNPTEQEERLWKWFKKKKYKVRRQHIINLGIYKYIADFYIPQAGLIIEIDGEIHNSKDHKEYDIAREEFLKQAGYIIMRFTNNEVKENILKIIGTIEKKLN